MGDRLFDELAKALATPMPRRRALRLIGSSLLAGTGIEALRSGRAGAAQTTGCPPPYVGCGNIKLPHNPLVLPFCDGPGTTCCQGTSVDGPRAWTIPKGRYFCRPGYTCSPDNGGTCVKGCPPERERCGKRCCPRDQCCCEPAKGTCCPKPKAIATVSGSTLRASTRTLDGSKSTGKLKSYEWTFEALDCGTVKTRAGAKKIGKKVTIKPLCTIKATLTVSDGRCKDSQTITVKVTPRREGWTTPFSHRSQDGGPSAPTDVPRASCAGGTCYVVSGTLGLNLPDCPGEPEQGDAILCPLLSGNPSWLGTGYKLTSVSDPGGPFNDYGYVASSAIAVKRVGLISLGVLPGGPKERDGNNFYGYNKAKGTDVDGFLNAIRQHEGLGAPGKPGTGHSQIMKADLAKPNLGPRREIEKLFGPSASDLQREVDGKLKDIDTQIDKDSADPLPDIGSFELWFWDDYVGVWRDGTIAVPGSLG
jgi:hypothetical protein